MKDIVPVHNSPQPVERGSVLFEEEAVDPREYWIVISRHRWAVVTFFLLAVFLTAISIPWGDPPLYRATTTLHIQPQTRGIIDLPEAFTIGDKYYETQLRLLTSRSLIAQVIRDLRLQENRDFTQTATTPLSWVAKHLRRGLGIAVKWVKETSLVKWTLELRGVAPEKQPKTNKSIEFEMGVHPELISLYLNRLNVSPVRDSQLVVLQFSSADPLLSQAAVNSHAATFIQRSVLTRFELTAEVREFLQQKLAQVRVDLERSEKAFNRFQKAHQLVSLEKGENLLLDRLKNLNSDLTRARSERIELESLHRVVQQRDNRILSHIINNPATQQMKNQITALEVQLASLATAFKSPHPRIMALQEELDQARKRLEREVNRIVQTIERDYMAAVEKERALTEETEKAKQAALKLQEKAVEYAILDREVSSNRALYETVLKKTKETTLTGEGPMPNLRVVDRAEIPVRPESGKWKRISVLSIVVGLLGGIGFAFFLNFLDNTVKTPEDVARFLRLPTFGIVPDVRQLINKRAYKLEYTKKIPPPQGSIEEQNGRNSQLVDLHHPFSLMSEAYQNIRTAILFSRADKPPQTILITSSQPHEGKTVTALNISIILAQSDGPVLLIDADLRAGKCHRLLGLENGKGLTNILTGIEDASRFVQKTRVDNLHFLSRGTVPPNPTALLGSEKMQQTLDGLAADFPFIIIDSPPLLPISDTVVLSTKVDGVILVARGQEVSRHLVRKACERLEYVDAEILGVVLNGVNILAPDYAEYRHIYESNHNRYGEYKDPGSLNTVPTLAEPGEGTVSPEFFDIMTSALTEVMGPMAAVVVRERIAALGNSRDAFPKTQVQELVDLVSSEISDEVLRSRFQERISQEILARASVNGDSIEEGQ